MFGFVVFEAQEYLFNVQLVFLQYMLGKIWIFLEKTVLNTTYCICIK